MRHDMNLNREPFDMIASGEKAIELRLFDEKRRRIQPGDIICFHLTDDYYRIIKAEVLQLYVFRDFRELYDHLPMERCGYRDGDAISSDDMLEYYTKEQQEEYGVVGIEIKMISQPYLVDGHMHLEYGELSEEYVWQFIEGGIRKGLDEIDILDHSHRFEEFRPCYDHLRLIPEQDEWLNKPK